MSVQAILLPCAAMVGLTAVVWVRLYQLRLAEVRRRGIDPQALAGAADVSRLLQDTRAADNFRNLFEVPVLFYVLCLALAGNGMVTPFFVVGAWLFVLSRIVHSAIHITYNRVMHRFYAYMAGTVWLFLLWAVFAVRLLGAE